MPSKCSFEGCDKKGSLQGKLPGTEKVAYFCCGSHMESSGATQTEKNKKQRKDCNAKMLLNRKRKQENGGEAANADGDAKAEGKKAKEAKKAKKEGDAGKEEGGKGAKKGKGKDEGVEKKAAEEEGGVKPGLVLQPQSDPPPPPPPPSGSPPPPPLTEMGGIKPDSIPTHPPTEPEKRLK